MYAIVFRYTDEFPAELIVRESWKWLIIKPENWNPREHLELEDLLTGVGVAAQGAVVWIEHSDSVSKDSAFRNKFMNAFQQRSKVRVLVPERCETVWAAVTINKPSFIYVVLMIYLYQERKAGEEEKQVRLGKMQN